jgi:hypothetical protein
VACARDAVALRVSEEADAADHLAHVLYRHEDLTACVGGAFEHPFGVLGAVEVDGAAVGDGLPVFDDREVEGDRHLALRGVPGCGLLRGRQADPGHALDRSERVLQDGAVELHGAVEIGDRDVGPHDDVVHGLLLSLSRLADVAPPSAEYPEGSLAYTRSAAAESGGGR